MDIPFQFYVSPQGSDANTGILPEEPFKTIQHAKEVIKRNRLNFSDREIIVNLRGGEYYLDAPLTFDENDNGNGGSKITYKNYNNEVPVINGGQSITDWRPYDGNIYCTNIKKGWQFHTLYENGVCCTKARYPKEGYSTVETMVKSSPKSSFGFKDGDIPYIKNTEDLQVYIWSGGPEGEWNWFTNIINVNSVDFDNRIIKLNANTAYEIGAGSRYYVKGALELLTGPGEFYLNSDEGLLYYWPRNRNINEANIVAPKMERIIEIKGSSAENRVRNLVFQGLTIRNTDTVSEIIPVTSEDGAEQNGTLYLENAEKIEVRNCVIHNTGMHGIYLNGAAANNVITGNLLYDIGHTGIQVDGYFFSSKDVSHDNIIRNNHVFNTGRLVGHGAGIQIVQSGSNTVSHNRIHHTPRYSISLKLWPAGFLAGKVIDGTAVTRENACNFSFTKNNIIEFNDVSHANYDSQDTGLIESWGAGPGNIIRNNRLHDSEINFSFGFGLYLDDASNYFTVYNNIIYGLQKFGKGKLGSCIYSKGIGNKFYNNIIADNNSSGQAFNSFEMMGEPNKDLEIERNIFYNSGYLYNFDNWSDNRFKSCDYNIYFNNFSDYRVSRRIKNEDSLTWLDYEEWKSLLDNKYDGNSIIQNPDFADPAKGDYRLMYNSPAYKIGFQDINLEEIGLEEDYPYADPNEELGDIFVRTSEDEVNRSWVELREGEGAAIKVKGRTISGFVADLGNAQVNFTANNDNVFVDCTGNIKAVSKGEAKLVVSVKKGSVLRTKDFYVMVS